MSSLRGKALLSVLLGAVIGLVTSQPVAAQVTTGSISGTVTDATGAIIPGASVTIRNVGTDLSRTIKIDANGLYLAADLPVGQYEVTVQQKGFATVKKVGIDLTVGAALVQDISLAVGATTEVVQVQAASAQVETATSEVGALVGEQQMVDLPLNGRNFQQLILLAPGMQPVTNAVGSNMTGRGQTFTVGGARPEGQAILLDGTDVQGFYQHGAGATMLGTSLGVESIAEFETMTNTYSAEFGGAGSVINGVTKAGTNALHGSAYEYLRNSAFDARNYFDLPNGPPGFKRNQFGGSLGGPIKKDSTFFFVNYEGYRQDLGETVLSFVPDLAAHSGQLPCSAVTHIPCTAGSLVTIPLSSVMQQLLAYYPTVGLGPDQGGGIASYTAVGNNPLNENYVIGRLDQKLGAKDDVFLRVVRDAGTFGEPFPNYARGQGGVSGWMEQDSTTNYFVTLEEKHQLSANLFNVARFGYTGTQNIGQGSQNLGATGQPGVLSVFPNRKLDSDIIVTGLGAIGSGVTIPITEIQNKFPFEDTLYWVHGAHDVRIGGMFERVQSHVSLPIFYNGYWDYTSLQSLLANSVFMFMAPPDTADNSRRVFHEWDYAAFIEDNWKVSRDLKLNLGARYAPMSNPTAGDAGTILEAIIYPMTAGYTPVSNIFQSNPTLKDIDPRVGLSYSPFGEKTVIHAGFGIFHENPQAWLYAGMFNLGPPDYSSLSAIYISPYVPGMNKPIVFPTVPTGSALPSLQNGTAYIYPHTPYSMQWNLRIERELGGGLIASAGFVGSRANHLNAALNANMPIYTVNGSGKTVFSGKLTNPALSYITEDLPIGTANYNGLQLTLKGRVAHALQMQLNYSWSKALSDADNTSPSEASGGSTTVTDPYSLSYDHGVSSFSMEQVFTASVLYDLPFKKNAWVSGYEAAFIPQVHSGTPFNANINYDFSALGAGSSQTERPDVVGNPNQAGPVAANPTCAAPTSIHNATNWFNPCAFVLPGATAQNPLGVAGTLGDEQRGSLVGPAYMGFDLSLSKTTSLAERLQMQLRAEAFNFVNHTNLGQPNVNLFSSTSAGLPLGNAGAASATVGTSRQMQFSVKFLF